MTMTSMKLMLLIQSADRDDTSPFVPRSMAAGVCPSFSAAGKMPCDTGVKRIKDFHRDMKIPTVLSLVSTRNFLLVGLCKRVKYK